MRAYCDLIGEQLGLSHDDRQRLQWAGLLHDVGKVGVPSRVLNKRGRLTAARVGADQGAPVDRRSAHPVPRALARRVGARRREHHERWDGDGYPAGLRGSEISLAARIIAVADAFDVMTAARSYKAPLPAEAARTELVRCAGTQFDEEVVRAFVAVSIGRLRRTMGPSAALAQVPVVGSLLLAPTLGAAAPPGVRGHRDRGPGRPAAAGRGRAPLGVAAPPPTVAVPSPTRVDRATGAPTDAWRRRQPLARAPPTRRSDPRRSADDGDDGTGPPRPAGRDTASAPWSHDDHDDPSGSARPP